MLHQIYCCNQPLLWTYKQVVPRLKECLEVFLVRLTALEAVTVQPPLISGRYTAVPYEHVLEVGAAGRGCMLVPKACCKISWYTQQQLGCHLHCILLCGCLLAAIAGHRSCVGWTGQWLAHL